MPVMTHRSPFIGHGRVDLDHNTVERSTSPLGLNRKIALFADDFLYNLLPFEELSWPPK